MRMKNMIRCKDRLGCGENISVARLDAGMHGPAVWSGEMGFV